MTTAQRREEILALLNQADAPIAAKDLAARFGVSRQVIVQDLAVIRASRPNIISTNRGYILQQQETGCLREFKVRHTPEQAGQELNLIVDHGGRVKISASATAFMGASPRKWISAPARMCRSSCRHWRAALPPCFPPQRTATTTTLWRPPPPTAWI